MNQPSSHIGQHATVHAPNILSGGHYAQQVEIIGETPMSYRVRALEAGRSVGGRAFAIGDVYLAKKAIVQIDAQVTA